MEHSTTLCSKCGRGVTPNRKPRLKAFPLINNWEGTAKIIIFDEAISQDEMQAVLDTAGIFGVGALRTVGKQSKGQFKAEIISWNKV